MFTPKDIQNILLYLQNINNQIKIDISEFNKNLHKHSDYPSLLSVVDAIDNLGFKSAAYQLSREDFESLPSHCLAQIKSNEYGTNELVLIEKKDDLILFERKQLSREDFAQLSTGIFILAEQKNTMKKYCVLCMIFPLIGVPLYFFNNNLFSCYILLSLSIVGLYLSVYFFESLFDIKNNFLNKLCHKSEISDCKAVSTSKKWKIFKYINFSDLSLVFFVTQIISIISLFFNTSIEHVVEMYLFNGIIIIPTIILSIFYQLFVEKRWCKVCLLIALNLILQLTFTYYIYSLSGYPYFKYYPFITFGLLYIICLITWVMILKKTLQKNKELTEQNVALNTIVNDYTTFKAILLSKEKKSIYNNSYLLSFGSNTDILNVTIITDPFCKYCKATNKMMRAILKNYSHNIKVNFLFNVDLIDKNINFYRKIVDSYLKNNEDEFFDFICNENDINTLHNNDNFFYSAKIDEYLINQYTFCETNKITFFPTVLLNGYEYPLNYDLKKLDDFINQLIADKNDF